MTCVRTIARPPTSCSTRRTNTSRPTTTGPPAPLHELLARLVIDLHDQDRLGERPPSLGGTVDEAATCLLNLAPNSWPAPTTKT